MNNMTNYFDLSSSDSPIPVKRRSDLNVTPVTYQGESHWVVQVPHSSEYQHFNDQEFGILSQLNGDISYREMSDWFDDQFAPYRLDFKDLTEVISRFAQQSLLAPTRPDVGFNLWDQAQEKRRRELWQKLKNPLAIRWKGWDPERFLNLTYPIARHLFSGWAMLATGLLLAAASLLLLVHSEEMTSRMPDIWSFLSPDNWLTLGLAVASTKMLHELGHAYVHRKFGGQCHQIGVMIFYLMPTLYCDTSDSWKLPKKWQRIAIAMGGVYVELILFSLATFGWWLSQVGWWENFCVNLMFVCSISAVVTNGNPLLKYDGYFALADWLEIPNLAQQSNEQWKRLTLRLLGDHRQQDHWVSNYNRRIFLAYGLGAFVFRVLLIGGVVFYLIDRFQSVGLQWIAALVATAALGAVLIQPLKGLYRHLVTIPGNAQYMKRRRVYGVAVTAMVVLLATLIPLPYQIPAECTLGFVNETKVFAAESGRIEVIHVVPGSRVQTGDPLMTLSNPDLQSELLEVRQQWNEVQSKIQVRSRQMGAPESANDEPLPWLESEARRLADRIDSLQQRLDQLELVATIDGVVFGATLGNLRPATDESATNSLSGNPLARENTGATLQRGDLICVICPRKGMAVPSSPELELQLVVEQRYNGLLQTGQPVKARFPGQLGRLTGFIRRVAPAESRIDEVPESIAKESQNPAIARSREIAQAESPSDVVYKDGQTLAGSLVQATARVATAPQGIGYQSQGKAFIRVGHRSLAWRAWNWLNETRQQSF